jgi:hypothetical protein
LLFSPSGPLLPPSKLAIVPLSLWLFHATPLMFC